MPYDPTVYEKSITATADTPFQVETEPTTFLTSVNIHCYTNDVYYGNVAGQHGIIKAGAVVWFDGLIRISDWWFKNYTASANANVVMIGILKLD